MYKNRYLIVCAGAVLIMIIQHPRILTLSFLSRTQHKKNDHQFQAQQVSMYSTEQLKSYISNSQCLAPESIALAAKELAAKENNVRVDPNDCSNCEKSLRHVAEALTTEQAKVKKLEKNDTTETVAKVLNLVLILILGGWIHYLNEEKLAHPDQTVEYEKKISRLNFIWIVLVSGIALIF